MPNYTKMSKTDLVGYCIDLGISPTGTKNELFDTIRKYEVKEIENAIANGTDQALLRKKIISLVDRYTRQLNSNINKHIEEMRGDNNSHHFIYSVLGISKKEGKLIDVYQNKGRFLYNSAGRFLEEATILCLFFANRQGGRKKILNSPNKKPKTFEIDFLNGSDAIEIKWRDATTDGDHITKEHTRIRTIKDSGYRPIRVMFFYPEREQALQIQSTLKTLYSGVGGKYYAGDEAWKYVSDTTGYDLKQILLAIVEQRKQQ